MAISLPLGLALWWDTVLVVLRSDLNQIIYKWNKHSEETQTLHAGCSKAEPKFFPWRSPLPGGVGRPKFNHLEMVMPTKSVLSQILPHVLDGKFILYIMVLWPWFKSFLGWSWFKSLDTLWLHCALAAAQCIVIGPVCLFVCGWVCVGGSVTMITRNCVHWSSLKWLCRQR